MQQLLDRRQVATTLAISLRGLDNLRTNDRSFPAPVRVGSLLRWRPTDLEVWLERKTAGTPVPGRTDPRVGRRKSAAEHLA